MVGAEEKGTAWEHASIAVGLLEKGWWDHPMHREKRSWAEVEVGAGLHWRNTEDIGWDSLMESEESDKDRKNKGRSRRAHTGPAFGVADLSWSSYRSFLLSSPLVEHSGSYFRDSAEYPSSWSQDAHGKFEDILHDHSHDCNC